MGPVLVVLLGILLWQLARLRMTTTFGLGAAADIGLAAGGVVLAVLVYRNAAGSKL